MLFAFICSFICAALIYVVASLIIRKVIDDAELAICFMIIIGIIGVFLCYPLSILVAGFTGGADCDYANGTSVGVVIESKTEGIIYQTCEVMLRQGLGEHSEVMRLSGKCLDGYLGKQVALPYQECFLPDYSRGSSGKYIK